MEPAQLPPAPERALPQAHFYSIEYPGYVREQAVPQAIQSLGGQHRVDRVFKRTAHSRADALIELALHPDNPFAHPIPGDVVPAPDVGVPVPGAVVPVPGVVVPAPGVVEPVPGAVVPPPVAGGTSLSNDPPTLPWLPVPPTLPIGTSLRASVMNAVFVL